jgi:hypothetical protein
MPKRVFLLAFAITFVFLSMTHAQNTFIKKRAKRPAKVSFYNEMPVKGRFQIKFSESVVFFRSGPKIVQPTYFSGSRVPLKISVFQGAFDEKMLSFFCRKEWQFEKATAIPLRIRIGSLDYADYLEQKPNSPKRW